MPLVLKRIGGFYYFFENVRGDFVYSFKPCCDMLYHFLYWPHSVIAQTTSRAHIDARERRK